MDPQIVNWAYVFVVHDVFNPFTLHVVKGVSWAGCLKGISLKHIISEKHVAYSKIENICMGLYGIVWVNIYSLCYIIKTDTFYLLPIPIKQEAYFTTHLPDLKFWNFTPGPGVVQLPIRLGRIWFRIQEQHGTTLSYTFVVLLLGKYVFIIYQTTKLLKLLYFRATVMLSNP